MLRSVKRFDWRQHGSQTSGRTGNDAAAKRHLPVRSARRVDGRPVDAVRSAERRILDAEQPRRWRWFEQNGSHAPLVGQTEHVPFVADYQMRHGSHFERLGGGWVRGGLRQAECAGQAEPICVWLRCGSVRRPSFAEPVSAWHAGFGNWFGTEIASAARR